METICSCTSAGRRSQTSSGPYGLLRRTVAPSSATPSTSIFSSRPNWWQATKPARSIRYVERIGCGPKRRCETVTEPALRESKTKYAWAWSPVLLADDLDRVAVGADGAVRAETVEDGADDVVGLGRERPVDVEARAGDVVDDPDGEAPLRLLPPELGEDRGRHRGCELLRGEAVAAADHARQRPARLGQRGDDVLEERLAEPGCVLAAVEHGDGLHGRRQRGDEGGAGERPEEPDVDDADLLAARGERLDGFGDRAGARAHEHDHALGIGARRSSRRGGSGARSARRSGSSRCARSRAALRSTGSPPRAPGRRRPDSGPSRAAPAARARARGRGARRRAPRR